MKKSFLTIIIITASTFFAFSQTNWAGFPIPLATSSYFTPNATTPDLVSAPNGNYFLTTYGQGIWKSTDSGVSWTQVNTNGEIYFRNIKVDGSGNIWATTQSPSTSRLFKSTDGGNTFTAVAATFASTPYFNILRIMANGNILVGTNSVATLQISTNGGANFNSVAASFGSIIYDVETDANNNIYVSGNGTGGWIAKSTNLGSSFTVMPTVASTSYTPDFEISGNKIVALVNNGIVMSNDLGVSWTSIRGDLPSVLFNTLSCVRITPLGHIWIQWNAATGKHYYSQNDGTSWTDLGVNRPNIFFSQYSFGIIFKSATEWTHAGSGSGVAKTFDGGITWQNGPLSNATTFNNIFISSPGHVYITGPGSKGYSLVENNNSTYRPVTIVALNANQTFSGFTESNGYVYGYGPSGVFRTNVTVPQANGWVGPRTGQALTNLVGHPNGKLYSISGSNLLSSTDGTMGVSQAITGFGGSVTKVMPSLTGDFIFVQSGTSMFKIDLTTAVATLLPATGVIDFAVGGNVLWVLTSTTTLQKSTDNGSTFTPRTLPATYAANRIWAFNDQVIVTKSAVSGVTALNTSINGGALWSQRSLLVSGGSVSIADVAISPSGVIDCLVNNGGNNSLHIGLKSAAPPIAPTNLKVIVNSPIAPTYIYPKTGAITMILDDNSNNEEYFKLERSIDNITWDSVGAAASSNTIQQLISNGNRPDMVQGTLYYYRVQAVNSTARSAYTNVVNTILAPYCQSTIPDNRSWTGTTTPDAGFTTLNTGPFTNNNIKISKLAGSNDEFFLPNYTFGISPSPPTGRNPNGLPGVTIQEDCGKVNFYGNSLDLSNGIGTWDAGTKTLTIKWRVHRNFNIKWEGTTVFTLNPTDPTPVAPTLGAYIYSPTEVFLAWNNVDYATKYIIQRSLVGGAENTYSTIAEVNSPTTSYLDKNLSFNTAYYYRIIAKHTNTSNPSGFTTSADPDGSGGPSDIIPTEVAIQTPPNSSSVVFRPIETDLNFNLDSQQGATWVDLDNDGDDDLITATFTSAQGFQNQPPSFFENVGGAQMTRRKLSIESEILALTVYRGIGAMDFNNDGKYDLYLHRSGESSDLVLINKGGWDFSILAVKENTPGGIRENLAMADYNKDGFIDFYIGLESGTNPSQSNNLLIKNVSGTSFSQINGLSIVTDNMDSRAVSFADYDNDGDQDIFAFNNAQNGPGVAHRLYKNNGDNTFTRVTGTIFDTDYFDQARTMSWGDIDNDGDLDLFLGSNATNLYDRLYRNNGGGSFTSLTTSAVCADLTVTYGSAFGDIDNDGDLDLLVLNASSVADVSSQNAIFRNDGTGTFIKVISDELFTNAYLASIGLALADVDKDGLLDAFVGKLGGLGNAGDNLPNLLFKSTATVNSSRQWLQVKLIGSVSNKAAIGARITVVTASPARTQIREVAGLTGYGSQNSLTQHFGLGTATTCTVTVKWPSGIVQTLTGVTSNQFITITEDNKGPEITTLSPADGVKSVPFNSTLEITFDESPIKVAGKKVSLWTTANPDVPVQVFDASAGVVDVKKVTFTPSAPLVNNTEYKVTIEDGAFKDLYNNLGIYNALIWKFTSLDITIPVYGNPAVVFPALVAKGKATSTFSVNVTDNVSVSSVLMSFRRAGSTDTFTDLPGTLNTATNQWDFSIQESFYGATGLEFYFIAKDPDNNSARSPATGVHQSLYETTPPVLTVPANPALIAKGFVNRSFTIIATDNFGVTSVTMSYRNTKNGTTYTDLAGTLNATVANQYDFSIPESAFNGDGLEYYFTATDATGNTVRSPLSTATPSTLKMLLDNQAPAVGPFNPLISIAKTNTTFTVKATDNLAVTSIVMKYRGISAKNFSTSAPGVKNANGDYDFAVSADWIDNMGIEYYFRAVDASKNIGVSPDTTAATNKYHKSFLKLEGASAPKFSLIKGSTGASGYQIIAVPLELTNKNIADNFEELGTADKTAYRFLRYHSTPTPGWDEYPGGGLSVLTRGEGYFLNSLKAETITLLDGVAPQVDQSNFFQMALKKGWNQIGNPYTVQIQWSDVIAYNKTPAGVGKLVKYDNGYNTNDPDGVLEPYKGGFVQVDNDITLKIPFKGFTTGGRMTVVDSDLGKPNWELPFTLTQNGLSYQVGMIGMNEEALLSKDNFDLPLVPRLNDYIDASFDHPEHFMKKFAQDVVPTMSEYTWEFAVASNQDGEATMRWNSAALGENSKEIYLLDVDRQQLVNMRNVSAYTFDPKQSKKFRIYFGENLDKKIRPSRVTLSKAYPNPTSGITAIAFSLPEQKASMDVMLEVYDLMGKKLTTLINGKLNAGFYTAEWDAAHASAAEGMYVCRLTVSGEDGHEMLSEKIVVKK